ncbi:hypothetical protein BJ944DRAFT_270815 [Cunninghamella echinulata]|nr:hypothetical protein BJ944DRAFT_270815 [Cunninghamella echinulata]
MKYFTVLVTIALAQLISAGSFDFIKPPSQRDQNKCEDYEVEYYGDDSYIGCQMSCQVNGYIGSTQIRSPPRELIAPKVDGSYCLVKVPIEHKKGKSNNGVDIYRQGNCLNGVCQFLVPPPPPICQYPLDGPAPANQATAGTGANIVHK